MEEIRSILDNLLSNLIWIPIGAFLAYVWFFIQVRLPNRRLWQYNDPSCLTVCAATSTMTNTGVYSRPATGIGQVRALAVAMKSLYRAYRKGLDIQNILLSKDSLQERIENDLLLLGGPKNNGVSEKFLELLNDEQPVRVIGNIIIWRLHRSAGRWDERLFYLSWNARWCFKTIRPPMPMSSLSSTVFTYPMQAYALSRCQPIVRLSC